MYVCMYVCKGVCILYLYVYVCVYLCMFMYARSGVTAREVAGIIQERIESGQGEDKLGIKTYIHIYIYTYIYT